MTSALAYSAKSNPHGERLKCVRFSLISSLEVERLAVKDISESTLYNCHGAKEGGVLDESMGTIDRHSLCPTCGRRWQLCPGHPAMMKLPIPVYHMSYMDTILKVLRSVCFFCSRALHPACEATEQGKRWFHKQYTVSRSIKLCPHCGGPRPSFNLIGNDVAIAWPENQSFASGEEEDFCRQPLDVLRVDSILNCIPDEDCRLMGFDPQMCHPRNFIIWVLLVPPPAIRPSVMTSEGSRKKGQDDITIKLQEINKRRLDLQKEIDSRGFRVGLRGCTVSEAMPPTLHELWDRLLVDVSIYMNAHNKVKRPHGPRFSTHLKSIMCKLKGKDGRIRNNLMGKRVDFCARTVITPDPNIDIDQVGVPEEIAVQLTIPEKVNILNIKSLSKCVRVGSGRLGGASTVITDEGIVYELEFCPDRDKIRLQHGWIVERFLRDDDVVMFNRQPSLHRQSIMGHRVKVMVGIKTFRLNLSCTTPYNADFDGDEMNLHVPQNPCAMAEVKNIMLVTKCLIAPKANKPSMGIIQDTLLGANLLSLTDTFITKHEAMRIIGALVHWDTRRVPLRLPKPAIQSPVRLWTGKQLLSCVLPRVTLHDLDVIPDMDLTRLIVWDGALLCGHLSKSNIGAVSTGVVQRAVLDRGEQEAAVFMSDIQRMVVYWLRDYGFSVGIGDCVVESNSDALMRENIDAALQHVDAISTNIPIDSGEISVHEIEGTISSIVNRVTMQVGGHIKGNMSYRNAMVSMVTAGSKGNPINLSQIMGCVGQNFVDGRRISQDPRTHRVLPFYPKRDDSVNGRGFVCNSYFLGVKPTEYFMHAMGGREGLVDTAVKTAVTGYLQRRMIKATESIQAHGDFSVRDSDGNLLEFMYGGDGMDAALLEKVSISSVCKGDDDLWALTHTRKKPGRWEEIETREYHRLVSARDELRSSRMMEHSTVNSFVTHLPCNVRQVITDLVCRETDKAREDHRGATPGEIVAAVDALEVYICSKRPRAAVTSFLFHVRYHMVSATLTKLLLGVDQLQHVVREVKSKFRSADIVHGEMVGCVAAQSIGEPCTQLTLNTFHQAGGAALTVNRGIPRFKELIDVSKVIKTPTMRIVPVSGLGEEKLQSEAIGLVATTMSECVSRVHRIDESEALGYDFVDTLRNLGVDFHSPLGIYVCIDLCVRSCSLRDSHPWSVAKKLERGSNGRCVAAWSDSNSFPWIVLLAIQQPPIDDPVEWETLTHHQKDDACRLFWRELLSNTLLCGTVGVRKAVLEEEMVNVVDPDTCAISSVPRRVIMTEGSCILQMARYEWIDWYHTICNHVIDVWNILGLEAAIRVLLEEMEQTICSDGTYVNHRHLMIMANIMTHQGFIMPLSRHGINKGSTNVLMRCSFEETADILETAARFGERDDLKGVTQSTMLGQLSTIGTGLCRAMTIHTPLTKTGEVGARRSGKKMMKSLVRRSERAGSSGGRDVRLVDVHTICTSGDTVEYPFLNDEASEVSGVDRFMTENECDPPFMENRDRGDIEGVDVQRCHTHDAGDSVVVFKSKFVPSSPLMDRWM